MKPEGFLSVFLYTLSFTIIYETNGTASINSTLKKTTNKYTLSDLSFTGATEADSANSPILSEGTCRSLPW
jgi:hypothetical protein